MKGQGSNDGRNWFLRFGTSGTPPTCGMPVFHFSVGKMPKYVSKSEMLMNGKRRANVADVAQDAGQRQEKL